MNGDVGKVWLNIRLSAHSCKLYLKLGSHEDTLSRQPFYKIMDHCNRRWAPRHRYPRCGCRMWSCWDSGRFAQSNIQSWLHAIPSDLDFLPLLLYLWNPYLFNLPCQIRPESELTAMSGRWVGPHCTCFKSLLEGLFYVVLCCIRPLLVCLSNGLPSGPSPLFPSCLHPACGYTFLALCSFSFTQVVCKLF